MSYFLLRRLQFRFLCRGSDFCSRLLKKGSVLRKDVSHRRFYLFGDPFQAEFCAHCSFENVLGFPFSTEFATSGCASDLCSGGTRSNLEKVNEDPNYVSSFFISVSPNTGYLKGFFHSCFSSLVITHASFRRC